MVSLRVGNEIDYSIGYVIGILWVEVSHMCADNLVERGDLRYPRTCNRLSVLKCFKDSAAEGLVTSWCYDARDLPV